MPLSVKDAAAATKTLKTRQISSEEVGYQDANLLVGDANVSNSNPVPVATRSSTNVTGTASIAALNIDLLTNVSNGYYDAGFFRHASVQIVGSAGITAGAITFEGTNDTTAAAAGVQLPVIELAVPGGATLQGPITIAASTIRVFSVPVRTRFIRVRVSTAFATANVQAFATFSEEPVSFPNVNVQQATAANLNAQVTIASAQTLATVTTVGTVTTLANGQTAHSAASTGSPVRVGGRVNTAVETTLAAGDASDLFMSTAGQLITKDFADPALDWQFASAAGGIINTTDVAAKAAAGAGVRNYITGMTVSNNSATATEFVVKDGASTVIHRVALGANAPTVAITFPTPLRGTANTAINVACITTAAQVHCSMQGYTAP